MTTYNYELISDFLNGALDEETTLRIRKLIEDDPIAKDIAKGILIMQDHFNHNEIAVDSYLNQLLSKQLETVESALVTHQQSKSRRYLRWAAVVAFLIISSIGIFQLSFSNLDQLVDQEISQVYEMPGITRAEVDLPQEFLKGMVHYQKQDFSSAFDAFSQLDSPTAIFASGLCKLYLEEYQEASEWLSREELEQSIFQQHSQWYRGLAYIKMNRHQDATNALKKLDGFKQKEAEKLLDLLKD